MEKPVDLSITVGLIVSLVMLSVSQLACQFGLSRTAVLYYESMGLLKPAYRSASGYRLYGEKEMERLRSICLYRSAGLSVRDVRRMLAGAPGEAGALLHKRLAEIEEEIGQLRRHQQTILKLLQVRKSLLRRTKNMTKDRWVNIMKSAGFSEEDMHRWHREFERSAPHDHQEFLQYLHIPAEEIAAIRKWSSDASAR